MKKLGYIILGILLGLLGAYLYCNYYCHADDVKAMVIKKPKGVITAASAQDLNDNWTRERQAANDSAARQYGRNKDNRWAWWSLEDMRDYLNYAENQSDSLGYTMDGVRMYLGVYAPNAGQAKKNLTTMFMVPTVTKKTQEASLVPSNLILQKKKDCEDCDPLNEGGGGGESYPQ